MLGDDAEDVQQSAGHHRQSRVEGFSTAEISGLTEIARPAVLAGMLSMGKDTESGKRKSSLGDKIRHAVYASLLALAAITVAVTAGRLLFNSALDRMAERGNKSREHCVAAAKKDNEALLRVARDLFPKDSISNIHDSDSCDSAEGGWVDLDVFSGTKKEALEGFYAAGWSEVPPGDQACEGWDCSAGAMKSIDGRVMYVLLARQDESKIEATLVYW
ncbi:hypothetical protein AB0J35_44915 [Nonomuraea angiospora]|uniref:hypothetical protein n=1 Tax=Nonomuraea angiospora TaxID=46172 RepID=UPI0034311488